MDTTAWLEQRRRMWEEYGWHEKLYYVNGVDTAVPESLLTDEDRASGIRPVPTATEIERKRRAKAVCKTCDREPYEAEGDERELGMIPYPEWQDLVKKHARRCPACGHLWP